MIIWDYFCWFVGDVENYKGESGNGIGIALDFSITDELLNKAFVRYVSNGVQKLRKLMGLQHDDITETFLSGDKDICDKLTINKNAIETYLRRKVTILGGDVISANENCPKVMSEVVDTNYGMVNIQIKIQ